MAVSTRVEGYPEEFMNIALNGHRAREPFSITNTTKVVNGLRMQWYGFLRALDLEAAKEKPTKDENGNLQYPAEETARSARLIKVTIESMAEPTNYAKLVFTPRRLTREDSLAEQLANAMADVTPARTILPPPGYQGEGTD